MRFSSATDCASVATVSPVTSFSVLEGVVEVEVDISSDTFLGGGGGGEPPGTTDMLLLFLTRGAGGGGRTEVELGESDSEDLKEGIDAMSDGFKDGGGGGGGPLPFTEICFGGGGGGGGGVFSTTDVLLRRCCKVGGGGGRTEGEVPEAPWTGMVAMSDGFTGGGGGWD